MDKSSVQSRRAGWLASAPQESGRTRRPQRHCGDASRGDPAAARGRLVEGGYAELNVRDIARDAGVNHALISYHFRGKQQLGAGGAGRGQQAPARTAGAHVRATPRAREREVAAGLRLLRRRPEVRLRAPADGADGRELQRRGAADGIRAAPAGMAPSWSRRRWPSSSRSRSSTCRCPRARSASWISWFWIGMEASMTLGHQREARAISAKRSRPSPRLLRRVGSAAARASRPQARGGR